MNSRTVLRWFAILLLLSGSSCDSFLDQYAKSFGSQVIVSESDKTPPSVRIIIPDRGSGETLITNTGNVFPISEDEYFFIVAEAQDPEGIQELRISRSSKSSCTFEDQIGVSGPSSSQIVDSVSANPGDKVWTRRWLLTEVAVYGGCHQQEELKSSLSISVSAKNFSGFSGNIASASFTYP